ncbi:MAG TPA: DUF5335 family protein [Methylomirabilota bacterium]|nr:DUF5335 family protein [Methylomirabilota bacterium]
MTTTEIPQKRWKQFCERISELYRGAVSIHIIGLDGRKRPVADDVPLRTVVLQKQTLCNDVVTIEAGRPDERPLQHQIVEPIRIVLRKDGESGRYNHLEIFGETGTTEIDFHPGINPALLEKLAA